MNNSLSEKDRHLVPRWRSLYLSRSTMELANPHADGEGESLYLPSADFKKKLLQWHSAPTVLSGAELVASSIVEGREEVAKSAARLVISEESTARPVVKALASRVLGNPVNLVDFATRVSSFSQRERIWRRRTRIHPNNALSWVELSLCEVVAGRNDAAKRAMSVALQLSPDNRHVLRSASRLFLHIDDKERAYDVLARSSGIRGDPWLIAAEVSMAMLLSRAPKYVKQGRQLIERNCQGPRQVTELAGALGTLELEAGRRKKARDLFRLSAQEPTGNALAQLEWCAYSGHLRVGFPYKIDTLSESDEAIAYRLGREERLTEVAGACQKWLESEPFSSRPYEVASNASAIAGKIGDALRFTENGLKLHHDNVTLLNNHAFALAHKDRLPEAQRTLDRLNSNDSKEVLRAEANRGLIAMRLGDYEKGRALYRATIGKFRELKLGRYADLAQIYFAREAAIAGAADAEKQVRMARDALVRLETSIHDHVLREAERQLRRRRTGR